MAALASYTPITARASTFRGRTVASRVTNGTGKVSMRATWMPGPPPPRISMAPCPGKRSYVFLSKYRSLRYLVAAARPSQEALCVHGKRGFLPLFFFSISLSSLSLVSFCSVRRFIFRVSEPWIIRAC